MTAEEQGDHLQKLMNKLIQLQKSKGEDYAGIDRLDNFKISGSLCRISAEKSCLNLIATKVARLGTLLSSTKEPNNESIQDSVEDLINYGILLHMLLADWNPDAKLVVGRITHASESALSTREDHRSYGD